MTELEQSLISEVKELNEKFDRLLELFVSGGATLGKSLEPRKKRYTLFEWLSVWLENEHKPNVRETVYKNDCGIMRKHVFQKTDFNLPLEDFKLMNLQALVASVSSSRQKLAVSNMLIAALRSAYNNELTDKDATVGFKKPKYECGEERALTRLEEKRLLRLLRCHPLETYIKVVLYAGLRRNEALGLLRKNIDFDNNEIYVEQQVNLKNELTTVLKTKTSKRVVKMFPELKDALLQFEWCKPEVRLFDFKPDYVTANFTKLCKSGGIPDFTIKSCRATFATRCEEMGIPESIIQAWLGHSTITTTKKHYIKLNDDFIQSEFDKALKSPLTL